MIERIRLVFARQGQGKSRLVWDLLQADLPPRLILWDPMQEYDPGAMKGGRPIGVTIRSYTVALRYIGHADRPLDRFRVIYRPEYDEPSHKYLEHMARIAYAAGDCTFVLDEASMAVSAWKISPALARIVEQGRHRNVSLILATRRPADIPKKVTSQADTVFIGAMHEAADLKYFRDCFGPRALAAREVPAFGFVRWRPRPGAPAEVAILDAERREVIMAGGESKEAEPPKEAPKDVGASDSPRPPDLAL